MISLSFKEGTAYVITPAVAAIKGNGRSPPASKAKARYVR
jgi:hypothetical protein